MRHSFEKHKGISSKSCPLFVYEDTTPIMTIKWLIVHAQGGGGTYRESTHQANQ